MRGHDNDAHSARKLWRRFLPCAEWRRVAQVGQGETSKEESHHLLNGAYAVGIAPGIHTATVCHDDFERDGIVPELSSRRVDASFIERFGKFKKLNAQRLKAWKASAAAKKAPSVDTSRGSTWGRQVGELRKAREVIKDRQYTTQADSLARRSCQTAMYHVTEAMTRWIAPILSFTADRRMISVSSAGS